MHRISKLTLTDFKFFRGKVTLNFDRNNILIYGENGSGKSGIYWGLYTFFQSVYKADVGSVRKYFDPKSGENLINIFEPASKNCAVELTLSNGKKEVTKIVSFGRTTTRTGSLVREIAEVSDFFNYRFLFQIHNFRNSEEIDLFPIFEQDILQFISFRKSLIAHDGRVGNQNAYEWFQYIRNGIPSTFKKSSPEYKTFAVAVDEFNSEMRFYVESLLQSANEYLQEKFMEPLKILFDFKNGSIINVSRRYYAYGPKILLLAEILNKNLAGGRRLVNRPQVFLNEARLTSLALAIRFSLLSERYIKEASRILIIDDLLMSLDMSNRDKVIDVFFKEFVDNSQLIILTHDRTFFELVRREIVYRSSSDKWKLFEMFVDNKDGFEKPFVTKTQSSMAKAKNYFDAKDYPACANQLRKSAEEILDRLVPSIYRRGSGGNEIRELGSLTKKVGKLHKANKHFTLRENLSILCPWLHKLDKYKDTLLNPLSHYNAFGQIYREELKSTIDTLMFLDEVKNEIILAVDELVNIQLKTKKGITYQYVARLQDDLRLFKLGNAPSFYGRCKINLLSCVVSTDTAVIHEVVHNYPILEISAFVDKLAEYTNNQKVKVADPLDEIVRRNIELEFTKNLTGQSLRNLKHY